MGCINLDLTYLTYLTYMTYLTDDVTGGLGVKYTACQY